MAIAFRKHTFLPLDDCLYTLRKKIPHLTRSSLHRCFQRHEINRLPKPTQPEVTTKPFATYQPGFAHIDITQISLEEGKRSFVVDIDRTTKYC